MDHSGEDERLMEDEVITCGSDEEYEGCGRAQMTLKVVVTDGKHDYTLHT